MYMLVQGKHFYFTDWYVLALWKGFLWSPWGNWTIYKGSPK